MTSCFFALYIFSHWADCKV